MPKNLTLKIVLMVCFLLTFLSAVQAQYRYGSEEGKILFEVEGWWATPAGVGFDVATINEAWYDDINARGGGDILGIEPDSKFSGRYTLGWKFREDIGHLSISYWDYSAEPSFSREGAPASYILGEILAHPYYSGEGYFDPAFAFDTGRADAVESMAKIEATFIDVDFSKNIPSDQNFSGQWSIGLRNFKYSHAFTTTYFGDPYLRVAEGEPLEILDIVTEEVESDGTGPKVGFAGKYSFTKNISLYGSIDVSFIPGKIDSLYISNNDLEADDPVAGDEWGPFEFRLNRKERDENFITYDLDAGFKMAIAQKLSVTFGYRLTKVENAIYRMRFAPDKDWYPGDSYANWDAFTADQKDVIFSGLYLGLAYEF